MQWVSRHLGHVSLGHASTYALTARDIEQLFTCKRYVSCGFKVKTEAEMVDL